MEFGAALLLFSVAGYITLRHCANRSKFRWAALDWEQNVFESAVIGLVLFFAVRVTVASAPNASHWKVVGPLIGSGWSACRGTAALIRSALPFPYAPSLVGTFVLGIVGGFLSNAWWKARQEVLRAVRNHGGDLKIFLHENASEGAPVSLTMKNRKVYVGLVMVPPGLEEPSFVTLLPTRSGYRDSAMRIVFTTLYEHVYEDLAERASASDETTATVSDFFIVLPLENVDSANRYDDEVYGRYFSERGSETRDVFE